MLSERQRGLLLENIDQNISILNLDGVYPLLELMEQDEMLMCTYKPYEAWCHFSFNSDRGFVRDFFNSHQGIQPVVILDKKLFEWLSGQYNVHYSIDCYRLFHRKAEFEAPGSEVTPLQQDDLVHIYRTSKYQRFLSIPYLEDRLRLGGGYCIRQAGGPVAWVMTHDDGSVGMLHVLEAYRGRGYARQLVKAMSLDRYRKGKAVFAHIEPNNKASLNLFESLGYEATGMHTWAYVSRS